MTPPSEGLPAAIAVIAGDAQGGIVAQPLADTLVVRVTDATSRPVKNVRVAFVAIAGGTAVDLIPDTAVTNADGQARSVWLLGQLAGAQRVEARVVGSPALKATLNATALADQADTLRVAAGDRQSGIVGAALTDSLSVLVTDRFGNPIAGQAVDWAVPAGQGSVSAAATVSGPDGRAAVVRTLGPGAGTQTASAAAAGLKGSPVSFTSTATAGGAVLVVKVSGDLQSAPAGFQLTDSLVVQVQDVNGNGVSGRNVNWVTAPGNGSASPQSSITNAQGMAYTYWTLHTTAGPNTLTAAVTGLPQVSFTATGGAAQPTTLQAASTQNQGGTVGLPVAAPPSVRVRDANNNPVQGVPVTFTVTAGGGSVADASGSGTSVQVATNAQGLATLSAWTLGAAPGANTVTAAATNASGGALTGSPVSFTATAAAGAASQLLITTQPAAAAQSGVVLAQQPVVALRDAFGNAVAQGGVSVTAALVGAGAQLRGTLTVSTNASGVATFAGLDLLGTVGAYAIRFTSGALTPDTSGTVLLSAGPAAQLVIVTQPSASAQSGVPFAVQPAVQVRDAAGNDVSGSFDVSAAIATGGGTLGGTTPVTTNGAGLASFTDLAITGSSGSRTLSFTSGALTPATSTAVTLGAGTATALAVVTQPSSSAQSGSLFGTQPVIELRDGSGNAVPQAGVSVTAAITGAPAGVTLGGTTTVLTGASGQAAFSGLSLTGPAGNYTLDFTAGGLTSATSGAITLAAGSGTALTLETAPPATGQSGVALAPAPVLQLRDGSGNAVNQAGVAVFATITTGAGGSLAGADTVLTNASGLATFSTLSIVGPVGSYTLAFGGAGLTGVTASPLTLSAGPAAALAITTAPPATAQSGVAFTTQPVLQVVDGAGNPVSQAGITVTAAIASGGGTLSGTTAVASDAQGVVAFGNLALSGLAGPRTLSFSATSLVTATSGSISLAAGAAANLAISAGNGQTGTAGSPLPVNPQVRVTDLSGNPVAGVSVTFTVTAGGGSAASTQVTDAAGFASVSWTLGTVAGANTLDASATLSGGVATVTFTATGQAGSAGKLAITTQPSATAQSGAAFAQQPVIQLQDINGNNLTTNGVAVIASAPGSVTLGGNTTAFTVNGVATFTNLSLTGAVGSYQLSFSGSQLTGVTASATSLTAGAASKLVVVTQPSASNPSGVAFAQQPVIQVQDAAGNPVASSGRTVTAAINSGPGGSLGAVGRSVTTDANGVATYTVLTLTGPVGSYTLLFSTAGLASDASAPFDITAGAASQMTAASATSQSATVGTAVAAPPAVLVRDAQNNPVAGVAVTFQVTAGGGSLNGAAAVTDNAGLASVTGWTLGLTAGTNTVTATASGLPTVTFNATGTAGAATTMALNAGNGQSATVNTAVTTAPSVKVTDASGNAVSGVSVTFAVTGGGGSLTGGAATTNASGIATVGSWTLGTIAGTNALSASSGTLTGSPVGFTATGVAGAAATIALSAGNGQSATAGTAVAVPPAVLVTDAFGNPKSGVAVTFAVTGGGGSVTGGAATSNASGIATVGSWTLGVLAGPNTLTATAAGLTGSPVGFTATGTSGTATKLAVIVAAPTTAQSGIAFTTQPVVQLQDASGNPVAQAGVTVSGALFSVTRVLSNASAVTDNAGQATFAGLTIAGLVGTDSLSFTSTGLTSTPRTPLAVTAGTPVKLAVTRQATATMGSGVAFTLQPQVRIQDSVGNNVSLAGVLVTATIASGPVGATILNPTATTSSTGTATFVGMAISGPVGVYTVQYDGGGYTAAVSASVTITPGPASTLSFTQQPPSTASSGTAFSPAPVLQLRDGAGNAVLTAGVAITASVASGPGATLTNAVATTDAAGAATFTGLTLSGTAGSYTLSFTGTGLTPVVSSTVSLSAGGGSKLALTTQPSGTASNGVAFPQQPVVQLQDGSGNPVTGTVTVTVSIASGGGTLGGTTSVSTGGGSQASFTNLSITGATGPRTLLFSAAGFTTVTSTTINVVAGAPTAITLSAGNGQTATVGTAVATAPAVLVTDASSNPVANVAVTFAVTGGGGSVSGGSATTNASGIASPLGWTLGTTAGANSLSATAAGLTGSPVNFTATGTAGAATQLAMVTQPSAAVQSGVAFPQQPAVRLLDQFSNPVGTSGVAVDVAIQTGGGSLSGTTQVNTVSGVATFSGLAISGAAGAHTLGFSSTGLTGVASTTITVGGVGSTTVINSILPATTVVGESYTVSVSVSGTGGTPTGTVVVSEGTASCNVTLSGGSGSCALASPVAGGRTVTATYGGDASFLGSSANTGHTVNPAATTTSITADNPDPSSVGAAYTVSYTVTPTAPGAGTPTGNVTVSDGVGGSCVAAASAGGCLLTSNTAGTLTLTASYAGDANFAASTSTGVNHTVNSAATTTTVTAHTPDPSVTGQGISVSFSVTSTGGTPSGSVTVSDGAGATCNSSVAAGSCTLTPTAAGAKSLVATYAGNGNFGGSISPAVAHTVNTAATTTAITADTPDPSTVNTAYTVSFTVAAAAPGAGTPTGNVTVSDGSDSCFAAISVGSCSLTSTSVGAKTLVATYAGDGNFGGSVSAGVAHTVNLIGTTTTITSVNPATIVLGQQVTVSYTVSGLATGNVTVSDGTGGSCVATVAAGSCSFTPTTAGAKTITATYGGDALHGGSSDTDALTVSAFGPPDAGQTTAAAPGGTVGNLTTITVQLRDSFGNLITTSGGAIIAASIGAGPNAGATMTVVDVGDGTYTITYSAANGPGDDLVDITLSAVAIGGSPYTNSIQ